jgi:pimeloyl-ACP methyl ester carboxylesterase
VPATGRIAATTAALAVAVASAAAALAATPPPPIAKRCGGAARSTPSRTFWFHAADGVLLDGAVLGSGKRGVVLATEFPADLCRWADEAVVLVRAGFRVLLFDFRGLGLSSRARVVGYPADVIGAVDQLRRLGATRVQVVGASLGGNAALVAAPKLGARIAGVASLSGEANLSPSFGPGLDAVAAMRKTSAPLLVMTAHDDALAPAADAHRIVAAARSAHKELHVFPGSEHGWDMLYAAPYRAKAQAVLLAFLRRNA